MVKSIHWGVLLLSSLVVTSCETRQANLRTSSPATPESRALAFLQREVPAWSRQNGCFSCHNNGDAARALLVAEQRGFEVQPASLVDTITWVSKPGRWDENKGDPGFSDKGLADIQFAASLVSAIEAGRVKDSAALDEAARRVAAGQGEDGAWHIGPGDTLGSPATYGTSLATYMALRVLKQSRALQAREAIRKAESWLRMAPVNSVLDAAALMLALKGDSSQAAIEKRTSCLKLIRKGQTSDGGWGPYADAPSEPFDTAVVLLALVTSPREANMDEIVRRGRSFLVTMQLADGSWPETTRPARGESYAQRISTTGWATLALLATR